MATFDGAVPTGVAASGQGRISANFLQWAEKIRFTAGDLREGRVFAYPDDPAAGFVSVQGVFVDHADRLWVLDPGSPLFAPTEFAGRSVAVSARGPCCRPAWGRPSSLVARAVRIRVGRWRAA